LYQIPKELEKIIIDNETYLVGYHTQEFRYNSKLQHPILCDMANAWLGTGYYFWIDVVFAKYWGEDFKRRKTGYYNIYSAHLDIQDCLNTTFDEAHYSFFCECIKKTLNKFQEEGVEVTLEHVNQFLADNFWNKMGVTGIIYDDLPSNPSSKTDRKYSIIEYTENGKQKFLYYQKRIQVVIFSPKNIRNFSLFLGKQS
jgi:hypothetical protein